jgi:hypothetical protein
MDPPTGGDRVTDAPPQREEGWYKVLIGEGLACLYWTGTAWQIPRRIYRRKTLPAGAVAAARPLEWGEEDG